MDLSQDAGERPELGDAPHATHELMQRIVKLRWMGLDDEADQISSRLPQAEPGATWVVGSCDTD
jgi:hypothetical protein